MVIIIMLLKIYLGGAELKFKWPGSSYTAIKTTYIHPPVPRNKLTGDSTLIL